MSTRTLKASVRHQPGVSVVDLHGEINVFAEDVLNAAYAEAERRELDGILLNFHDSAVYQQHRHCSDRQPARPCPQAPPPSARLWSEQAL